MSLIHFDDSNFDSGALASGITAMVDFWAPWCGPCKMLGPVIDEIADELDGSVVVGKVDIDEHPALAERYGVMTIPTVIVFKDGKVDIDEHPALAERYGVMTIPTVIVFKDGKEVERSVGAVPKRKLLDLLK